MKSLETNLHLLAFVVLSLLLIGVAPQNSLAQTISVSPVALSYGVPTVTPFSGAPVVSSQETVTVTIAGASSSSAVTFGTVSVGNNSPMLGTDKPGDFIINGNSCAGTFTSPNTCLVTLTFSSSLAPATTLETALLTINFTSGGTPGSSAVPLSGAYGSIMLFNETNVATPPGTTSFSNLYTVASTTLNLICPGTVTATISGTPDGLGNVLVDNYITLATGSPLTPVTGIESNYPAGNVCSGTGATADSYGDELYTNCFTENYELAAVANFPAPILGLDPDTFANSPNSALYEGKAGGVPPITFSSSFISSYLSGPYPEQALFTLLSSGPSSELDYANSTLFLATSCSPGGLVAGGSVTGNPTPTNTVSFDSNPSSNFSVTDSTAQNPPPAGTTPVYTQIAVPQQLFQQLVAGTSAAPDVCFRLNSELDYSVSPPAPMCAGVQVQCWDPTHTTLSGANCDPSTPSLLRNLYFSMSFDSLDGPANGANYLYSPVGSPAADACSYYLSNQTPPVADGACANSAQTGLTGPGLLLGADQWLCAPGSTEPCTPLEPSASGFNTLTPATTQIYSSSQTSNCALSGLLAGDLCPLDTLTQFRGAADIPPAGNKGNSTYIPVVNHPLPTTTAAVGTNGWVNSTTAQVNFNASAATYNPSSNNPAANGFIAAAIYSVTYGYTPASSPLPDTTYPVPGDSSLWNTNTNPNFGDPLCNVGGTTPSSFTTSSNLFGTPPPATLPPDGLYNLHYFATDCALTEGLVFNPQGSLTDPTVNWASFPNSEFGIDTVAPTLTSCTPPAPIYQSWYGSNITVSCTVTDQNWVQGQTGSGFPPTLSNSIQGSQTEAVNIYTNVAPNTINASAVAGAQIGYPPTGTGAVPSPLTVTDLAGNPVAGGVSAGPFQIDLQAPTITGSAGSSTVGGAAITVTFTCSDAGSGIPTSTGLPPSVGCVVTGTPGNYASSGCSPNSGGTVSCGGTIPTTMAESGTLYIGATDNVGNVAALYPIPYSVIAQTPTVTVTNVSTASEAYGSGTATVVTATLAWTGSGAAPTGGLTFASTAAGSYSAPSCTGATSPITCTATFTPTATDAVAIYTLSASYVATANYNGSSSAQTNNFSIAAQTPTVTVTKVSPASEAYGSGTATVVTATLSWTGSGAAPTGGLTFASTAGGSYSAPSCTGTSSPITCTATFTPTATDAVGTYTLSASYVATANYNGAGSKQINNFTITGTWMIAPIAPCTGAFSTASAPFSVGQSGTCNFLVTNNTATAATVSMSIPGGENGANDADDFAITTNGCKSYSVPANGGTCQVTVTWTPDSDDLSQYPTGTWADLEANHSGTLYASFKMTGVTEDPTVTLSPTTSSKAPYNFTNTTGSQTETFTLTNSGPTGTTLFITKAVSISGSSDFKLATGSGYCSDGQYFAVGATCDISVTFTAPKKTSTVTATVTITSNAVGNETAPVITKQYIYLSGK
jgi:hypothetical protein